MCDMTEVLLKVVLEGKGGGNKRKAFARYDIVTNSFNVVTGSRNDQDTELCFKRITAM